MICVRSVLEWLGGWGDEGVELGRGDGGHNAAFDGGCCVHCYSVEFQSGSNSFVPSRKSMFPVLAQ